MQLRFKQLLETSPTPPLVPKLLRLPTSLLSSGSTRSRRPHFWALISLMPLPSKRHLARSTLSKSLSTICPIVTVPLLHPTESSRSRTTVSPTTRHTSTNLLPKSKVGISSLTHFPLILIPHPAVPDVRVVAVIEPDSLANLVTNLSVAKCANAQTTYLVMLCLLYSSNNISTFFSGCSHICHPTTQHRWCLHVPRCWSCWLARMARKPVARCPTVRFLVQKRWLPIFRPRSCHQRCQLQRNRYEGCSLHKTDRINIYELVAATPDPITQGNPNYDESLYINVSLLYYFQHSRDLISVCI